MAETEGTDIQVEDMRPNWGDMIQSNAKVDWRHMMPEAKGDLLHAVMQGIIAENRA